MRQAICAAFAVLSAIGTASCDEAGFRQLNAGQRKTAWLRLRHTIEGYHASFPGNAGIVVKDLSSGWKIEINGSQVFPAASLIKIPIMAACFQAAEEGRIALDAKVALDQDDITPGSGKLKAMPEGTVCTVEQLIELMIEESDNTAANILIEKLTPGYLNSFFREQGLRSTSLARKMMDFSRRGQGVENYTSTGDIAMMLERMYRGGCVNARVSEKCMQVLLRQKMKDRIPKRLPKETPVAHKTGLERYICHDAGVVYTPEGDFLICVLTKSRSKGGYRAMKDFIAKTALAVYATYQPSKAVDAGAGERHSRKPRSTRIRKGG